MNRIKFMSAGAVVVAAAVIGMLTPGLARAQAGVSADVKANLGVGAAVNAEDEAAGAVKGKAVENKPGAKEKAAKSKSETKKAAHHHRGHQAEKATGSETSGKAGSSGAVDKSPSGRTGVVGGVTGTASGLTGGLTGSVKAGADAKADAKAGANAGSEPEDQEDEEE